MSLRIKFVLFGLLCAMAPLVLMTYWTMQIMNKSLQSELEERTQEILAETNVLIKKKISSSFSYSFLAISNPAIPLALQNKNEKILASVSRSMKEGLDLDILEVIDGSGMVVYNAENPGQMGMGMNRLSTPFVQQLYRDYQRKKTVALVGMEKRTSGLSVLVGTILPGSAGGHFPGAILLGFYLNDKFLKEIQSIVDAQFVIFSKDEIYAKTFNQKESLPIPVKEWTDEQWKELDHGKKYVTDIALGSLPYAGAFAKIEPDVGPLYLGVFLSKAKMVSARRHIQSYILVAGIVGVFLAVLVAMLLGRSMVSPIKNVISAVDELAKGNINARVEVVSKDEIGFLAYTFNTMMSQLKETQDKLIRSERLAAIGQLASGVGHELRNPLAAIKNAIYFVRNSLKKNPPLLQHNEQVQQMMEIAENEVSVTVKISNDLLEFSRTIRINPVKVGINSILSSVLNVVSIPSNVMLEKKFVDSLPSVFVDPERMRQVFINLVNNAVEAMPSGGTLQIETRHQNGCIEVYVRDTGCGINEEQQEKIFEPLFSTKAKGTGLGLAIVRGIVEHHHGQISVKSVVGQGTEFVVSVPVATDQ